MSYGFGSDGRYLVDNVNIICHHNESCQWQRGDHGMNGIVDNILILGMILLHT
jgi:hypothetical protein